MNPPKPAVKAILQSLGPDRTRVEVHFNPTSLVYTVENSSKQTAVSPKRKQVAAQFTGKLTMDLQFDTTGTGEDVRVTTNKVAMFMQSSAEAGKDNDGANAQAQPVLSFQWGSYVFKGTMDSFKETIDFFSADGVPLRAMVSIGLARQDKVFDEGSSLASIDTQGSGSLVQTSGGGSVNDLVTRSGVPSAARQLGTDNGLESLRFTAGASLQVNAGIQLNAAVGFSVSTSASAGGAAGLSIGGAAGLSFGASAGVTASAGLQLSAGVGGGALFGGQASAGVAATAGAFAGLEVGRATVSSTARLDPLRMLPATNSTDVSTGAGASFGLGGAASAGSGFTSEVGAQFSFSDRLVFDSGSAG